MLRILVTGGAGFIGTKLIQCLLKRGHSITVLDKLESQVHGPNPHLDTSIEPYVSFIKGDVNEYSVCCQALNMQDVIIHLVADTATGQSMYEINKCTRSNINGTANLLQCLCNEQHHIQQFILASSRAVYGEGKYFCPNCGTVYPKNRTEADMARHFYELRCPNCCETVEKTATDEASPLEPMSIYGITKLTQEQYISIICKTIGIPYTIFRFQNVYGEGQSLINPYTGILTTFTNRILTKHPVILFEDGLESRDFIHVQDVVTAIMTALDKKERAQNQIFNVGTGKATSLITLLSLLYASYGIEPNYNISHKYRLGDIRHNYADIHFIHDKLGFLPQISLEKGIARYVAWSANADILDNNFEKSIEIMERRGILIS